MEKKEKVEKPYWVQVVEKEFSPFCQNLVGQMASQVIQSFLHVYGLNKDLGNAVYDEMYNLIHKDDEGV